MLLPLLVLGPIRLGLSNICGLSGLITATEQEKRCWTALCIVHTIARALVNSQLPDATTDCVCITEVAETYASKASPDTGSGPGITQFTHPLLKRDSPCRSDVHFNSLWLCFSHSGIVACTRHRDNRIAYSHAM